MWQFRCLLVAALLAVTYGKGVVLILGSNTGYDIGWYNNTYFQTPNIASLAQNGVIFNQFYTNNVAGGGASRSVILSGLPSHQNGQFGSTGYPGDFNAYNEVKSISTILGSSPAAVKTGFIGVKGIGPDSVFKFDYSQTEENNDAIGIGRNITLINQYVTAFLNQYKAGNFFLVISLADPERCADASYGQFCENYGNGSASAGTIPDWTPVTYDPTLVTPPYYITRADPAKEELANLYRAYDRLDQGVGLYLNAITTSGADTLVAFSSTGAVDFPGARYNAFDCGARVPLIVSYSQYPKGTVTHSLASSIDLPNTILDFFGVSFPSYTIFGRAVTPTGTSLLPVLTNPNATVRNETYFTQEASGNVAQTYPIRAVKQGQYVLIRNSYIQYPLSTDIFNSATLEYIKTVTWAGGSTGWWKTYSEYLERQLEFELYDHSYDQYEVDNVAYEPKYKPVYEQLRQTLYNWQLTTQDPWICDRKFVWSDNQCKVSW